MQDWHDIIRDARNARRWSQKDLAVAVDASAAAINKIENDKPKSTKLLLRIIHVLQLDAKLFPPEAYGKAQLPVVNEFSKENIFTQAWGSGKSNMLAILGAHQSVNKQDSPTLSVPEFARDPAYWALAAGLVGEVPLFACTENYRGDIELQQEPIGTAKRPPLLQAVKDAYALMFVGDRMSPEFEPGDTLFINPRLPVLQMTPCVFYGEEDGVVRATVNRYISSTNLVWKVMQHNPKDENIALPREAWKSRHRIVAKQFR